MVQVMVLHKLCSEAGFGDWQREFIDAGGVKALVEISVTDWPQGADLAFSECEYDQVAVCYDHMHHSMR